MNVDKEEAGIIKNNFGKYARGFRSLKVRAKIGKTEWLTSIFPDKTGIYLLPLKASLRKKEDVFAGDTINFQIEIL